jgi:hypothetical protein
VTFFARRLLFWLTMSQLQGAILACRTRRNFSSSSSSSSSSELDHSPCYVCVCLSPTKRTSSALQKTLEKTFLPIRTRNGYFLHGYETVVSLQDEVPVFMFWRNFAKFRPQKYDFDLYKGFFMEKKDPKSPNF